MTPANQKVIDSGGIIPGINNQPVMKPVPPAPPRYSKSVDKGKNYRAELAEKNMPEHTKLNSATAAIKRGITVKVLPVELSEEHVNLLNDIKSSYDIRNQREEQLCKAITSSGKLKVYLTAIISALISAGIMLLVFCNSHYVWGHRMLVAAIEGTIKAMERQAEKTLFLESVLKDYIEEESLVEKYEARKTDYLEYAVFRRFTGSSDVHVFNIFIKDEEVVKVTKKYTVPSKKKGGIPEYTWKEVRPIERKTE